MGQARDLRESKSGIVDEGLLRRHERRRKLKPAHTQTLLAATYREVDVVERGLLVARVPAEVAVADLDHGFVVLNGEHLVRLHVRRSQELQHAVSGNLHFSMARAAQNAFRQPRHEIRKRPMT